MRNKAVPNATLRLPFGYHKNGTLKRGWARAADNHELPTTTSCRQQGRQREALRAVALNAGQLISCRVPRCDRESQLVRKELLANLPPGRRTPRVASLGLLQSHGDDVRFRRRVSKCTRLLLAMSMLVNFQWYFDEVTSSCCTGTGSVRKLASNWLVRS